MGQHGMDMLAFFFFFARHGRHLYGEIREWPQGRFHVPPSSLASASTLSVTLVPAFTVRFPGG